MSSVMPPESLPLTLTLLLWLAYNRKFSKYQPWYCPPQALYVPLFDNDTIILSTTGKLVPPLRHELQEEQA